MKMKFHSPLTAVIQRSEKYFIALCPELDVVSQGKTVEDARRNIAEAVELFLETASPSEIKQRWRKEIYISPLEVAVA
jgi:predicted RNase H-like HicB family nuclease